MVNLTVGETKTLKVAFSKAGQPGAVTGVPTWSSSNQAVVSATAAHDGFSVTLKGEAIGTATITLTATATDGKTITATDTVSVALPAADTATIA